MFVHEGAKDILITERKASFFQQHIEPLKKKRDV